MVNGALRFNRDAWVFIEIDLDNGDNEVVLELYHPDHGKMVLTGVITWED